MQLCFDNDFSRAASVSSKDQLIRLKWGTVESTVCIPFHQLYMTQMVKNAIEEDTWENLRRL